MKTRQQGFTLWELMVVLAVAGIILSLAVPSFREFHRSSTMTAAANGLVSGLLIARSEAVKRQLPVTFCITADPAAEVPACVADSGGAFVVFVDEAGNGNAVIDGDDIVLMRSSAPGGRVTLFMQSHTVTYGANGFPRGAATRFLFCDDRGTALAAGGQSAARVLLIDPTGRGTIRSDPALVAETATLIAGGECGA